MLCSKPSLMNNEVSMYYVMVTILFNKRNLLKWLYCLDWFFFYITANTVAYISRFCFYLCTPYHRNHQCSPCRIPCDMWFEVLLFCLVVLLLRHYLTRPKGLPPGKWSYLANSLSWAYSFHLSLKIYVIEVSFYSSPTVLFSFFVEPFSSCRYSSLHLVTRFRNKSLLNCYYLDVSLALIHSSSDVLICHRITF